MAWSVVDPKDPLLVTPERLNVTDKPPEVRALPLESFALRVAVIAEPEDNVLAETLTRDWLRLTAPGWTVTVGSTLVTAFPPIVAVIVVAEPATRPVNVAV